jgi:hypothetical protein
VAARPIREVLSDALDRRRHVYAFELLALITEPCLPTRVAGAGREEQEVAGRYDVDRRPHQGRLHGPPLLQRLGQRLATEVSQAAPESNVRRRRILALQAGNALERLGQRHPPALEQQLPRQQRAVERPRRERSVSRHVFGNVRPAACDPSPAQPTRDRAAPRPCLAAADVAADSHPPLSVC